MRQRSSQSELSGYPLRRLSDKIWWLVQLGALAAILLASIKSQTNGPTAKSFSSELSKLPKETFPTRVARGFGASRPQTITSRVVSLPSPRSEPHGQRVDIEVETRQMRFEKSWMEPSTAHLRAPASAKEDWLLVGIVRKADDGWESVPLVQNHQRQTLGSVFVELEEGVNEFKVTFRNKKGRESSYPILVRHFKKRTT